MPGDNDDCVKCRIDGGMGVNAARMYAKVVRALGLAEIHAAAAEFYADVLADCEEAAQMVFPRLNRQEKETLLEQIDKACYRADKMIVWSRSGDSNIQNKAAVWTDELFEWAKDDQTFFTALAKENS